MVPESSPIQLRTANPTWLLIAPQLSTLYPNRDMVLVARSVGLSSSDAGAPRVAIANGEVSVAAEIDFAFQLLADGSGAAEQQAEEDEEDLFVITCPIQTAMTLAVGDAVTPTDTTACPEGYASQYSGNGPGECAAEHCGCVTDGLAPVSHWSCDFCCDAPACERLEAPSTHLGAEFSLIDCALRERSSNIGAITMGPLIAGMINGIVIPVVMPMLNEWAADLWVMPQMQGFSAVNAELTMRPALAEVALDVLYLPNGTAVGPPGPAM